MTPGRNLVDDIRWGLEWGFYTGLGFTFFFGILPSLFRWSLHFESVDLSLIQISTLYMIGGLTVGGIAGLLRPLTDTRKGCAIIGIAVGVPTGILGLVVTGRTDSFVGDAVFIAFWTLVYCPLMGVAAWYGERNYKRNMEG